MTRQTKWKTLRSMMFSRAEELVSQHCLESTTAVPIVRVAKEVLVKEIRFAPLFSDGGIASADRSFVIFVNAKRSSGEERWNTLSAECPDGSNLPERDRFTIAHEIAHAMHLDPSTSPPSNYACVREGNRSDYKRLEKLCNLTAGRLLIPRQLFQKLLGQRNPLDARVLVEIAQKLRVSGEALVHRICDPEIHGAWRNLHGIICYIRISNSASKIRVAWCDAVTRELLSPNLLTSSTQPQSDRDLLEWAGMASHKPDCASVVLRIPGTDGRYGYVPHEGSMVKIGGGYILTIRRTGELVPT